MFDELRKTVEEIASRKKVDDFEVVFSLADNTSFDIEQRDLTVSSEVGIATLGLRLMKKGKLTYAMSTAFDRSSLARVIDAALTNLEPTRLSGFSRIPAGLSWDRSDSEVAELVAKPNALKELLSTMVKTTWEKGKGRFERLNGGGGVSAGENWVWTAHSPEPAYQRGTAFNASVNLDSRDMEFMVGRKLPAASLIENLGAKVAQRLPKKSMKPADLGLAGKEVDVILHPMCLSSLFNTLVAEQLYASNKLVGLSRYKPGEKLASSLVTIHDDATCPELLTSAPTDHEGTPSRRVPIFSKGVFKNFLYDAETAVIDQTRSTASGMRRPVLAEDVFEAPVRPTLRALVMDPGDVRLADMMKSVKRGILLKFLLGIHTADRVTGAFANTAFMSYVITDGRLAATTEPGTWAMRGNALELLKNIIAVSRERFQMGSTLLPWVKTRLWVG